MPVTGLWPVVYGEVGVPRYPSNALPMCVTLPKLYGEIGRKTCLADSSLTHVQICYQPIPKNIPLMGLRY